MSDRKCQHYTIYDGNYSNDHPLGPRCANTAKYTTCDPVGGVVCEDHKCRCSKPLLASSSASEEQQVEALLSGFFDGHMAKVGAWMAMKNPLLGGMTPRQMMQARPGKLLKIVRQTLAENER